jgi:hypothetical protein
MVRVAERHRLLVREPLIGDVAGAHRRVGQTDGDEGENHKRNQDRARDRVGIGPE